MFGLNLGLGVILFGQWLTGFNFGDYIFDGKNKPFKVLFGCFQKLWYPQIIHSNRVFHYKPSILGYPYFWKHSFHGPKWLSEWSFCFPSGSRRGHWMGLIFVGDQKMQTWQSFEIVPYTLTAPLNLVGFLM